MVDILIGLLLLLIGGAAGWALRIVWDKARRQTVAEQLGERERQRLREDHQAFEVLLGYSPDMAYGLDKVAETEGADDVGS